MPVPTSLPLITSPNGRPAPSGRWAAAGANLATAAASRRLAVRASFTGTPERGGAPGGVGGFTRGKMGAAAEFVGKRRLVLGFCGIRRVKKPGRAAKSGRGGG